MAPSRIVFLSLCIMLVPCVVSAQATSTPSASGQTVPSKVDFERDVLPIFREQCGSCHGPAKQRAGMRLDRRSSAEKAISRRIVPGNSANSMVYHRLIGDNLYGPQMPPSGAIRPEEIALVKAWIDQGAKWPDSLANEADLPPVDPRAVAMIENLRHNNLALFMKAATADHSLLNARGPDGSTPYYVRRRLLQHDYIGRTSQNGSRR